MAGEKKTLTHFRGLPVLLIFFNPACGFCRDLAPKLLDKVESGKQKTEMGQESGARSQEPGVRDGSEHPIALIISTGDAEVNRQVFNEHKVGCPVLLQKQMEVASAYQANGTPSGCLISSEGKVASELAIGAEALLALLAEPRSSRREEALTSGTHHASRTKDDQSLLTPAPTKRWRWPRRAFWESLVGAEQDQARWPEGRHAGAQLPPATRGWL